MEAEAIRRFYQKWEDHSWEGLGRKQIKFAAREGIFIALNKKTPRLNHHKLRNYAIRLAPIHIYSSVIEYLRPDRVDAKYASRRAYPIRGDFVIDIDSYMNYQPHRHKTEPEGFCYGCLDQAKALTLNALDVVAENYRNIDLVFSGKHGFHIHVHDFEVRDWTYYDDKNPLKSHEVARRKYVEAIKDRTPQAFDISHYILSCDVMRVMTLPESLNGETGLICSSFNPTKFKKKSIETIVAEAKRKQHITSGLNWAAATEWKNPRFNLLHSP